MARSEPIELLSNSSFIDGIGIEVGAAPFDHLGMALMVGVGHGFEIFGVAPRPADILGRAAAFGREQARVDDLGFRRDDRFELDRMPPVITEVVDVFECLITDLSYQLGQGRLVCRPRARTLT